MEFFLVYIQEAHPSDAWQMAVNERDNVVYKDPKDYEERVDLASTCSVKLGIEFPALVDNIENATELAYTAWPDRLYIVNDSGQIAFKSEAGPFGFNTTMLSQALERQVQSSSPSTVSGGASSR